MVFSPEQQQGRVRLSRWLVWSFFLLNLAYFLGIPAYYFLRYQDWVDPGKGFNSLIDTGSLQRIFEADDKSIIHSIAISPDGKILVVGLVRELKIWNLQTGQLLRKLEVPGGIWRVAISPDGKTLATTANEGVEIWRLETGERLRTVLTNSTAIALSPNGLLISGSSDKTIRIWNLKTGQLLRTLSGHSEPANYLALNPNGKTLVSASYIHNDGSYGPGTIKVWSLETGEPQRDLAVGPVGSVALSPDGLTVAASSFSNGNHGNKTIQTWNIKTGALLHTFSSSNLSPPGKSVGLVTFSRDGKNIIEVDEKLLVWDIQNGKLLRTLAGNYDGYAIATGVNNTVAVGLNYWARVMLFQLP